MNKINNNIFWIASYPKSGNTWMRSIISSLFYTYDGNFNFPLLKKISLFETMEKFKYIREIDNNDYKNLNNLDILSNYWIKTQQNFNIKKDEFIFLKTHHSCIKFKENYFTNKHISKGIIYIVRDPRDVVISYSKHAGISIEKQIELIKKQSSYLYQSSNNNVHGVLLPWDQHIESWRRLEVPKIFIKYEDMLTNTAGIIYKLINFFSINFNANFTNLDTKIPNIVNTTNFKNLSNIEKKYGFDESSEHSKFFRSGEQKQWKNILTVDQAKSIESAFKKEMQNFKYI
jgi:hypothetical protein